MNRAVSVFLYLCNVCVWGRGSLAVSWADGSASASLRCYFRKQQMPGPDRVRLTPLPPPPPVGRGRGASELPADGIGWAVTVSLHYHCPLVLRETGRQKLLHWLRTDALFLRPQRRVVLPPPPARPPPATPPRRRRLPPPRQPRRLPPRTPRAARKVSERHCKEVADFMSDFI